MEKFIIIYESRINGVKLVTYHSDLYENKNKETTNVYAEELTTHRKEATRFYDSAEALKIANLFKTKFHKPAVSRLVVNAKRKHDEIVNALEDMISYLGEEWKDNEQVLKAKNVLNRISIQKIKKTVK